MLLREKEEIPYLWTCKEENIVLYRKIEYYQPSICNLLMEFPLLVLLVR